MAGGTYTSQNKVRPGVYINLVGEKKTVGSMGERGTVSVPLNLNWGQSKAVIAINAGDDLRSLLGYDLSAPEVLLVREAFKKAKTLLLYRLNEGTKATAVAGSLTLTAKFGGVRGNDITVAVKQNVDDEARFDVITFVAKEAVDSQTAANIAELKSNAFVSFGGTGALTLAAGVPLVGGSNGTVTNQDHTDYLAQIELKDFNTIALVSADLSLKSVYAAFARRLREEEGRKIQVVLANYPSADSEGVISVKNGVKLLDGTVLDAQKATVWVAAATAGAPMNKSLTYEAYEEAADADIRYTNSQTVEALQAGEFLFTVSGGRVIVEQDINTFTGYSPEKGKAFSKNRVIRVLDGIANDFKHIFESFYIGKVDNNADGRSLFRNECLKYLNNLQSLNAIQNFDAQADLSVAAGEDTDSIIIEAHIQPVDSVEKVYMKVTVK
ncbi:phage tail sheath protein [Paenibacillus sp. FSL A5-0031]|uniref:phage tail sheath family protein n=1 Tax=Paenibacillus sp. FSL A5-0031 TaxID=1920420 RepID=UPI00096D3165|nr:phage tail sheath family protein [Paenibacillus sp. FSL A5-0031]OME79056.1 phage tail sheath protein [Paenibacillus sp. FSL A5-0031]